MEHQLCVAERINKNDGASVMGNWEDKLHLVGVVSDGALVMCGWEDL